MPGRHISVRLDDELLERLDAESRRAGCPRSELVNTLLDEGLRMAAHPGIVFRSGPAGRRPGLASGPDVWEVARVFRHARGDDEAIIEQAVPLTGLAPHQLRVALGYYADYRSEIDAWMDHVDEEAERQEAAWLRQQALLRQ